MESDTVLRVKKMVIANYRQVMVVFFAFSTMMLVSYFYTSSIVRQQVQTIGELAMEATQISLSTCLHEAELLHGNTFYNIKSMLEAGESNQEILSYLRAMHRAYGSDRLLPEFLNLYAYIRGDILGGSGWAYPESYVATERPWYIGAIERGGDIFYSDPYIDAQTGGMCITISQQLIDPNGESYGVFAVDVKLVRIIDYLAKQEVTNNGYAVLLDGNMRFISHQDSNLVGTKMTFVGGDYAKLAQMLPEKPFISAERFRDANEVDSVAFFRPIFNGWHIGVIIPRASFFAQAREMGTVISFLGIIFMLALSSMLIWIRTVQMRAEKELFDMTASLNVLESVFNAMDIFIYVTNTHTAEILFANDKYKEHFMQNDSDADEHCWSVFGESRCASCPKEQLTAKPGELFEWEERRAFSDRFYRTSARFIDWPDGRKVVFHYRIDITEQKKSEADKMEALKKAEQASRAKIEFLSRMSHEMRTPMNAIIGMATVARKAVRVDEMHGYFEKINNSALHLLGIINDILDMSKIETGKMRLTNDDVSVKEVLGQIYSIMGNKFSAKHQNFVINIDDNLPPVISVDKEKLTQVITNLLSNANRFTPDSGNISLSVHLVEDLGNICRLQFVVEDDGIGIPEEQQERLFSAFEQYDNTITRQYGGTGLGLAISQSLVNMMDGEIWVKSTLGEGAKFGFTITVGVIDATQGGFQNPEDDDTGCIFSGKRILLVDDIEINREIVIAMLEDTGVVIDCAANGREACAKFAANPGSYSLILMDIHMPEMDGYEAAKTIRAMKFAAAQIIPIIAVTADVLDVLSEDIEECYAAGMNDHLGKPLHMDTAIAKIRKYILR